jgi:hypothetical protein
VVPNYNLKEDPPTMAESHDTLREVTLVPIDIAKDGREALIEAAPAQRQHFRMTYTAADYRRLAD